MSYEPVTWWCDTCGMFIDATTLETLAAHIDTVHVWHTLNRDPANLRELPTITGQETS